MAAGDDESPDLSFGLRPNSAARSKSLDKPAVLHGGEPKPELTHPALADEPIDFGQERRVHTAIHTRYSVRVNPHETTCVRPRAFLLLRGMANSEWLERLAAAIQDRWVAHGRSLASLSKQAGLGPNYVSQMLAGMKDGTKEPSARAVIDICEELGVSITWIFLGIEMTAEDESLLLAASKMDKENKKRLLDLLNSIQSAPA